MRFSEPTQSYGCRLPPELIELLKEISARTGIALQQIINDCLLDGLGFSDQDIKDRLELVAKKASELAPKYAGRRTNNRKD